MVVLRHAPAGGRRWSAACRDTRPAPRNRARTSTRTAASGSRRAEPSAATASPPRSGGSGEALALFPLPVGALALLLGRTFGRLSRFLLRESGRFACHFRCSECCCVLASVDEDHRVEGGGVGWGEGAGREWRKREERRGEGKDGKEGNEEEGRRRDEDARRDYASSRSLTSCMPVHFGLSRSCLV